MFEKDTHKRPFCHQNTQSINRLICLSVCVALFCLLSFFFSNIIVECKHSIQTNGRQPDCYWCQSEFYQSIVCHLDKTKSVYIGFDSVFLSMWPSTLLMIRLVTSFYLYTDSFSIILWSSIHSNWLSLPILHSTAFRYLLLIFLCKRITLSIVRFNLTF